MGWKVLLHKLTTFCSCEFNRCNGFDHFALEYSLDPIANLVISLFLLSRNANARETRRVKPVSKSSFGFGYPVANFLQGVCFGLPSW